MCPPQASLLIVFVFSGKWYDTRAPRTKHKQAHPEPPPRAVLNMCSTGGGGGGGESKIGGDTE
jgi:hypothetical protein